MTPSVKLGFLWPSASLSGHILLPRYYDEELNARLAELSRVRRTVRLGDLVDAGDVEVSTGDEIGKMAYGTGDIPFVRTSDVSNWEIRANPKQGVSPSYYEEYGRSQDVRKGDLLFVRDGTYRIGQSCLVSKQDLPLIYQSHILKFRVTPKSPLPAELLLLALTTPIVRAQIRSKQFTADIIDSIGNRYRELLLPMPKDTATTKRLLGRVRAIVRQRASARESLRMLPDKAVPPEPQSMPDAERSEADRLGFLLLASDVRQNVLVPRFYDPRIVLELSKLEQSHDLLTIGDEVHRGVVELRTGVEVGKMAYGTGSIPFIRTSDMPNWELAAEPKQTIRDSYAQKPRFAPDSRPGDILIVRDGTYLVGSNCVITRFDGPFVFASGIYRMRSTDVVQSDPYLLWALLNSKIVQRQFRAYQFTRDVIDTIGHRIDEIVLPRPKAARSRRAIGLLAKRLIELRAALRNESIKLALELGGEEAGPLAG